MAKIILALAIAILPLLWAMDLYRLGGFALESLGVIARAQDVLFQAEQLLACVLGLGLALVFIHYPAKRHAERGKVPWYDLVAAAVGLATGLYIAYAYPRLSETLYEVPTDGMIAAAILYVLSIEGLRRAVGYSLVAVVLVFSVYALVGHLVPGSFQTRKVELDRLILYLGIDTSAMFGLVMLVAVTVVVPFIFFGQLLLYSGGSSFFNDFSLAAMGRYRGGSAKISVTASSLFGSVSGIVVSNILATGVVTIPLMKKAGFPPRFAAAVEATASTGGQLMPPVMGAVAFLMADFLEMSYAQVMVAAIVPSLLYYVALFIQADLEAAKMGITRVEESEIPRMRSVAWGFVFFVPFAALIVALFSFNLEAEAAAMWASGAVLLVGLAIGYRSRRMRPREVYEALKGTGESAIDILMIGAAAGFIIGILQTTGLGFAITLFLVNVGGGDLLALLVIAALMCIVLGMGMPTLAVYVLLAVLIAPSLVEAGVTKLAAHMFILYLGMMSFITPPVAIAAFFAASLAKAEPMRTGFTAMRFGWTAYIVPFLFVFSPSLLLDGTSWLETVVAVATAVGGVWLVSAGMTGYFTRPMTIAMRAAFVVAGACLMLPDSIAPWAAWTDLGGFLVGLALVSFEIAVVRRRRAAEALAVKTD